MSQEAMKPPTQVAGAQGISAPAGKRAEPKRINWTAVAALPPFQMFLAERGGPDPTGRNSHAWALKVATELARMVGDEALFQQYAEWHGAKGYWPNETPMGVGR